GTRRPPPVSRIESAGKTLSPSNPDLLSGCRRDGILRAPRGGPIPRILADLGERDGASHPSPAWLSPPRHSRRRRRRGPLDLHGSHVGQLRLARIRDHGALRRDHVLWPDGHGHHTVAGAVLVLGAV